jgi:GNAT superfamily N-acetyltransferase
LHPWKELRLFALKNDPEAFHSTYSREVAFPDEVHYARLANVNADTFVAFETSEPKRMVSMMAIVGPLPDRPEDLSPLGAPPVPFLTDEEVRYNAPIPMHYRLNAVYTRPDARRKGLALELILKSLDYIKAKPLSREVGVEVTVAVEIENASATAV